ncbi:inosine triphosphate pyrophosphatase-like protein [Aspergillus ambiguus]|uniref:non-canonical purine NTP pyrophosphatase n=1 Tax=Aspergillus ambiguus TaxID=176160 RepID=UPI003CCD7BCD
MQPITFITSNANKLTEVNAILPRSVSITHRALDIPEIQGSLEEIAIDKCRRAADIVNGPVLVEDSALAFHAMNGLPGPYIKYFFEALGNTGLNRLLDGFDDRTADAVCTFAYSTGPGTQPVIFQGRITGKIVSPRGQPNFGWEPIFEYEGTTLAEMENDVKNKLSHRYRALFKFQEWMSTNATAL